MIRLFANLALPIGAVAVGYGAAIFQRDTAIESIAIVIAGMAAFVWSIWFLQRG